MANTAFNAKLRIVDNNRDRENAPERNVIMDFSLKKQKKQQTGLNKLLKMPEWKAQQFVSIKASQIMMRLPDFAWGGLG